jgi:Heparan-alpha-glucosaminide N-acetyltransferase, catalytic
MDVQRGAWAPHSRIVGIDAARGSAMILVCLSHIKQHFVDSAPALTFAITAVTRIATPTFLLLSGFVIGYLLHSTSNPRIGLTLVDRGLFLMLIAHLLGLSELLQIGVGPWLLDVGIVDVVGLALCVAVLVRNASATALLLYGASLAFLSWPIAMIWSPAPGLPQVLGTMLFGISGAPTPRGEVAIVPYLGLFLVGMGLSARSHAALVSRDAAALARRFLRVGLTAVTIVIVGILLWRTFRDVLVLEPDLQQLVRQTIYPRSKWPPSPAYLLFYGGAGLLMACMLLEMERRHIGRPIVAATALLGRASLMCFVVQDWLLLLLPVLLGFDQLDSLVFWFAYLAAVLGVLFFLSWRWDKVRGNRFLSIGLRHLGQARSIAPARMRHRRHHWHLPRLAARKVRAK